MKLERRAKKYANALMATARQSDSVDEVDGALREVVRLLKRESSFRSFFQTRRISPEKKKDILDNILGEKSHPIVSEFFGLLAARQEHHLFVQTAQLFGKLRQKELNLLSVTAVIAEELEEQERDRIKSAVDGLTEKRVEFSTVEDPRIIGGIRLRVGNLLVDGSIKGSLEKLREELIQS